MVSGIGMFAQLDISHAMVKNYDGYVLLPDGEREYGEVHYAKKLFGGKLNKIIFIDKQGYQTKFRASQLMGFGVNGQDYVSKDIDDVPFFLRQVVQGEFSLYFMEYNYVRRHLLPRDVQSTHGSKGRTISMYVEKNGHMHRMFKNSFKKQSDRLFGSKTLVKQRIDNQTLDFFDMEKIIKLCNTNEQSPVNG
jgi:hypothetical protein